MRILVVTQMYPGPEDPDLGAFVALVVGELERQGHQIDVAAIDRRGGPRSKYARLGLDALRRARAFRPDVVYAHFLVPAGSLAAAAAAAARAPLVLTAHGQDVANIGSVRGIRLLTRLTARRAAAVIAVSGYLRDRLAGALPELDGKLEVIDCGVDMERFAPRDQAAARARLGLGSGPLYLCAGSLIERKNVLRLAEAFERLGHGRLVFLGDGPLRPRLEGRPGVQLAGRVPHDQVAEWIAACDVLCQPSLLEPFGQALLEAMASGRPVVATDRGGPPEFVTGGAGILVDPESVDALEVALRAAAELPVPNEDARAAAAAHDSRRQAERIAAVLEAARV